MRQSLLNLCTVIILSTGLSACDSGKDAEISQQQTQAAQRQLEKQAAILTQTQAALDQAKQATVDAQAQLEQQRKTIATEKDAREVVEKLKAEHDAKAKLKADARALAEAKAATAKAQKEAAEAKAALATKLNDENKVNAAAKAKLDAAAKAKLNTEAKAKHDAETRAKLEANAKIKAETDAKIKAQQNQTDTQAISIANQRLIAANVQLRAAWKAVLARQPQQLGAEQKTLGQLSAEHNAWDQKRNTDCQTQSATPTANQEIGRINCLALVTEQRTAYLQQQLSKPNNATVNTPTPATPTSNRNTTIDLIQQGLEIFQQSQQQK